MPVEIPLDMLCDFPIRIGCFFKSLFAKRIFPGPSGHLGRRRILIQKGVYTSTM